MIISLTKALHCTAESKHAKCPTTKPNNSKCRKRPTTVNCRCI